ncbi:MAG: hypothetical protein C7B45_16645 [Sulfobacillus acidophilus]|uniref:Uncharacterized protein n=1 Tax=Sulfobacillus acidophilus TaxID=53633 RepID=A0A2T2WCY0_9FIRM|nr:MAG: hypothetical protein C7B45_16645 [Sulfobacillus acidophilus]
MAPEVPAHQIVRHLIEVVNDPTHVRRTETPMFRASKRRLKQDGHYRCYICGTTQNLQVHHYGAEWMFAEVVDYDKLKAWLLEWDVYGYSHLLRHQPLTSVDDVRNCLVLCREHHLSGPADGAANGIHDISFPAWISQKLVKTGAETVPQDADPADGR